MCLDPQRIMAGLCQVEDEEMGIIMKALIVVWVARISFFLAVCMAAMNPAYAGPANPEPTQIAQPDGTLFQAIMRGDEFQGWMETADGYTVVKNPATGFYEYAIRGSEEELIPSGIRVTAEATSQMTARDQMPPKGLRPPRNTALEQYYGFPNAAHAGKTPTDSQSAPAVTGTWAPTPLSETKKNQVSPFSPDCAGCKCEVAQQKR